jgi:4'-phosphopantetheinyl transferase
MLRVVDYFDGGTCARPIPVVRVRVWPASKGSVGNRHKLIERLEAGAVDLWQVALEGAVWGFDELVTWLSAEERARYDAIQDDGERRRGMRTRIALRGILALYLGCPPQRLPLQTALAGRPCLGETAASIDFNVSHSGDRALIAVAPGRCRVGVDVEKVIALGDLDRLASALCTPAERQAFAGMPPADRLQSFFALWTSREAVIKAIGTGWSRAPPLTLAESERSAAEPTPIALPGPRRGWISTFEPAAGYSGALAVIS